MKCYVGFEFEFFFEMENRDLALGRSFERVLGDFESNLGILTEGSKWNVLIKPMGFDYFKVGL